MTHGDLNLKIKINHKTIIIIMNPPPGHEKNRYLKQDFIFGVIRSSERLQGWGCVWVGGGSDENVS